MFTFFRNYRHFFIAFVLALFVFSSMFALTYSFILNKSRMVDHPVEDIPISDDYVPKPEDNLNVVWMGCTEQNAQPNFYILLQFDAVKNQCTIISVPPETSATIKTINKTIDGFYAYGGMQTAAEAVGNLFLLEEMHYVRTNRQQTKALFDYFSGMIYTMENPVQTDDYQFQAGSQLLDGNRLTSLIFSSQFTEKEDLLKEFMLKNFNDSLANQLDQFYDLLFLETTTDLNRVLFNKLDRPVHRFLRGDADRAIATTLTGIMHEELFVPDKALLDSLRTKFQKPVSTRTSKFSTTTTALC